MTKYDKTHRCEKSLLRHASVRKRCGVWYLAEPELDSDFGCIYLHTFRTPINYCPFCGERLNDV